MSRDGSVLPLAELQRRFVAAVLATDGQAAAAEFAPLLEGAGAADRLGVYRGNSRENFAAALAAGFPAVHAAFDPEEFREMAWSFQRRLSATPIWHTAAPEGV